MCLSACACYMPCTLVIDELLCKTSEGPQKMQDREMQNWKTRDQIAEVENAGLENTGSNCIDGKCRTENGRQKMQYLENEGTRCSI